ncbi:hypothetical protein AB0C84_45545 [Actinomadura sp. NPDC048955]|uniref:hypothetical protein n=1 Tax=Actinomadura sp. NPDC048955 TaxID=3158228 RepID=UPI0033F62269
MGNNQASSPSPKTYKCEVYWQDESFRRFPDLTEEQATAMADKYMNDPAVILSYSGPM